MIMINFAVDSRLLKKITPVGLQPDPYQGKCHISLVAKTVRQLRWKKTIPLRDFGSLSLQLYVRENTNDGPRFGTWFLKHYARGKLRPWLMSRLTNSNVDSLKITHPKRKRGASPTTPPDLQYSWPIGQKTNHIRIRGRSRIKEHSPESKIGYILRHSDRYTVNNGQLWRFEMTTPQWDIWDVAQAKFDCDIAALFGKDFVKPMSAAPASVFLSRGNVVTLSTPIPVETVAAQPK